MAKAFGNMIFASPVPWTLKRLPMGYILKRGPSWMGNPDALSAAQLKACIALAEAATANYGTRGKLPYKGVSMPAVAVKVAAAVPSGSGVHGGISAEARRAAKHSVASSRINALRSLLAKKGA